MKKILRLRNEIVKRNMKPELIQVASDTTNDKKAETANQDYSKQAIKYPKEKCQ